MNKKIIAIVVFSLIAAIMTVNTPNILPAKADATPSIRYLELANVTQGEPSTMPHQTIPNTLSRLPSIKWQRLETNATLTLLWTLEHQRYICHGFLPSQTKCLQWSMV